MSQSIVNDGSRRWLKFENMDCLCKKRAAVRISESEKHPYRLYYSCMDRNKPWDCNYLKWCKPIGEISFQGDLMIEESQSDCNNDAQSDLKKDVHSDQQRGKEVLRRLKNRVKSVDKSVEAIKSMCQLIIALTILGVVIDLFKK